MSAPPERDFLAGGGEMGALMRAKDWAVTPLGPVGSWPQSLRTAVSILLNSRYPMFIFWGPRLIKIYNDAYRPITGEKHPDVLGLPGPEVWPEIWADIGPMVERVMHDGEATWSEDLRLLMHRRGFREEVYFTFSYSPIRDESGGIGGLFCACTETTAKVLGERRLKILRDLAAGPSQARSAEEARALSLAVLHANPSDVSGVRFASDGELALAPSPHLALDDEYRGFFDLVRRQVAASISNASAVEAQRQRAEALAELDRAKTAFFSNVSHEFRTPLTLMLGPLEDGLADAEAPLPEAQRERLLLAHRNGLRLQKLVNTLLDFSRIEAGRAQASYAPTDLAVLTADLASTFRSAIEKAGLRLEVDCPKLTAPAYVDRDMWEKIVLNLLSNAFKFTFEGGIGISLRQAGDRVRLAVSDTGTGIPEAELPHVFERFRRVEGARSRTHEGTGIGLALVQELVKLHGGAVTVDSMVGRGSTFVVSLPVGLAHLPAERIGGRTLSSTAVGANAYVEEALRWLPDAPALREPEPGNEAMVRRQRIVWADDNADMRDYVRRLLEPRYEVDAFADGEAALAAIRARPPDLVLSDVMMPGLDGLGLVRALRADPPTRSLPVILLSARAGEEAKIAGYDAGANDYVYKPFAGRELLARISARLELTRLEASLAAERAALANLFAQTPIPTAVLKGPELVFEMANPAYIDVVGGREVVGKPLLEALPEARGQEYDALMRRVMRTGTAHVGRESLVRLERHGRIEDTYFTFIYAPLRSESGEVDRVIAIVSEVTEQVRARKEIEASEKRYRAVVESQSEMVCRFRPDGTILFVNEAYARARGTSPEVLAAQSFWNHIPASEHAKVRALLARLTPESPEVQVENRFDTPAGERWTLWTNRALAFDEAGRAIEAQSTGIDITERKRAEAALLENREALKFTLETAEAGDWEMDLLTGAARTSLLHDRCFGATKPIPDWSYETFLTYVHPDDRANEDRKFRAAVASGKNWNIHCRVVWPDGSVHWIESSGMNYRYVDGKPTRMLGMVRDITERKAAEEALREADRRKDEFLAVLSHELRNPLAPIRNAVTLLHEADGDAAIRHQMRGVLERQVSHLIRLVDDLLDVARIGRGDIGLQKRTVPLAEVLAAAMETSRPRVESGGHTLVLDFPDRTLGLFADPVRVAQVISNLLNNAAAYTPHGGRIELSVRAGEGWVSIAVRDNGVGIAAEALAALFGMFSRGDVAKHHPTGFGIGLALARRLVEMHGGTIEASSAGIGKGAEFTVRLPLAPHAPAAADAAPASAGIAPKRILIVDDNRDAADSLCGVLKVLGNEVQVARDGASALEEFRLHDPSVVILDIGMPGMTGYDVARQIRAHYPERRPQLIALTGWGQDADRRRAEEAGFDHHLVKPAEMAALQALLASLR